MDLDAVISGCGLSAPSEYVALQVFKPERTRKLSLCLLELGRMGMLLATVLHRFTGETVKTRSSTEMGPHTTSKIQE